MHLPGATRWSGLYESLNTQWSSAQHLLLYWISLRPKFKKPRSTATWYSLRTLAWELSSSSDDMADLWSHDGCFCCCWWFLAGVVWFVRPFDSRPLDSRPNFLTRGRSTTSKCMDFNLSSGVGLVWISCDCRGWFLVGFWFGFSLIFSFQKRHTHGPRFCSHPNS
jgi:hypothetical protein